MGACFQECRGQFLQVSGQYGGVKSVYRGVSHEMEVRGWRGCVDPSPSLTNKILVYLSLLTPWLNILYIQ